MTESSPVANRDVWRLAWALALTSAVSLGLARFSYAMILPPMRADLGWSYFLSGALNTVNALGYLMGALMSRRWLRRWTAAQLLRGGGLVAVLVLWGHALGVSDADPNTGVTVWALPDGSGVHTVWLMLMRWAGGMASAAMFVAGGVLAARLASWSSRETSNITPAAHSPAGLILGIYYGGTGLGIVLSAWLVLWMSHWPVPHAWRWAWVGLGVVALLFWWITARWMAAGAGLFAPPVATSGATERLAGAATPPHFPWRVFVPSLVGYFCFGLGYIGYMTFIITLLRERQLPAGLVVAFFTLLGLGVMASSRLWAGLLQRHRDGRPMMQLNALLALATLLPVFSVHPLVVLISGGLFGSVFLSVVASTTALVRHNVPEPSWASGIAAYTVVFAAGQILGPSLVGWVADGPGGLLRGFVLSAGVSAVGAAAARRQVASHLSMAREAG